MRSGYFLTKADFLPVDDGLERPSDEEVRQIIYDITGEWYSVGWVRSGTFHYILRARHNKKILFLKVARYRELISSLRLEEYLYRAVLDRSGIGVEILGSHFEDTPEGLSYILMHKAGGMCLREIDFSEPDFSRIVESVGKALSALHEYTGQDGFGLINPDSLKDADGFTGIHTTWNDFIYLNLNQHLDYLRASGGIELRVLEQAGKILTDSSEFMEYQKPGRLLHGDPGSHNIFILTEDTDITCSIIDWEDSLLGDPVFDLAAFGTFFRMHEFLDPFIRGYNSMNSRSVQDNDFWHRFWLYYLRIVLAKGVLRFKLGYDTPGQSLALPKITMALKNLAHASLGQLI